MKNFFIIFLFLFHVALAEITYNHSELFLLYDNSSYEDTDINGRMGYGAGFIQYHYFKPKCGILAGLRVVQRMTQLNSTSIVRWYELPVGFSYRMMLLGFRKFYIKANTGIYYAKSFSSFTDDEVGKINIQSGFGLFGGFRLNYFLEDNRDLGFLCDINYSNFSPFKYGSFETDKMLSFMIGINLTYGFNF